MTWIELCIALAVFAGCYVWAWSLCRAASNGDEQARKVAQRLAMQQEAFRWPKREEV